MNISTGIMKKKSVLLFLLFTLLTISNKIQAQNLESIDLIKYCQHFHFSDKNIAQSAEQEQYLADFFFLLQHVEDDDYKQHAINNLFQEASPYPEAIDFILDESHRYLTDRESPVYNPKLWEFFRRDTRGHVVLNFQYTDEEGRDSTLYTTPLQGDITLFFYNPECEHCMQTIAEYKIREDDSCITDRETIWAIHVGENDILWHNTLPLLPKSWKKIKDRSHLMTRRWYDLEKLPHIVKITANYQVKQAQ